MSLLLNGPGLNRGGSGSREGSAGSLSGRSVTLRHYHGRLPHGQAEYVSQRRIQPGAGSQDQRRTQLPLHGAAAYLRAGTQRQARRHCQVIIPRQIVITISTVCVSKHHLLPLRFNLLSVGSHHVCVLGALELFSIF